MTLSGGTYDGGAIYQINTDGTGFKVLHSFLPSADGSAPMVGLVADGNILYGTTTANGGGNGTIFKLDLNPPPLYIKNIQLMVVTNQILIFTNLSDSIHPITYITNHIGSIQPAIALTWLMSDAMNHTLLKSHDLSLSVSNWTSVPANWTNGMDTNEVGAAIVPNPSDPPWFFRLQSVSP